MTNFGSVRRREAGDFHVHQSGRLPAAIVAPEIRAAPSDG